MSDEPKVTTGLCSGCAFETRLNKNGMVRLHSSCVGSGHPPIGWEALRHLQPPKQTAEREKERGIRYRAAALQHSSEGEEFLRGLSVGHDIFWTKGRDHLAPVHLRRAEKEWE